ncbi:ABC transporter ATP-binding protein [Calidifontibacter indicus]|uniref:ABC-type multidrug transport system ATPase subunit n=1 Tax=Calidifontibacter indicus TaxID=419650 RepID=A0A3D9UZC1_9MICO|nr:ATP-binding cassette domain-containing protein [Calidifontibacter indicus]REF30161.1 ABC-type multidrug transport system ATPase subunit [Calidifontibacter indicus]
MADSVVASNLSHIFRGGGGVSQFSTALTPGTIGLIGNNGAGKSTLLSILATVRSPRGGSVEWFGDADPRHARSKIALMPQDFEAPTGFTVLEYVKYVGWLRGLDRRASVEAARAVIDRVGLARAADARMKSLSGGMLRRVAFAQALVASPSLLLLDEPTTGLDPEQRRSIRGLMSEAGDSGRIVVLSSHIVEDVVSICDRIIALREGELVLDVPTSELLTYVAQTDASAEEAVVQILSGDSPLCRRDNPESA